MGNEISQSQELSEVLRGEINVDSLAVKRLFDLYDKNHTDTLNQSEASFFCKQLQATLEKEHVDRKFIESVLTDLEVLEFESEKAAVDFTRFVQFLQLVQRSRRILETGFGTLYRDVLLLIFSRLDSESLARCCAVNRNWNHVGSDDVLWRKFCDRPNARALFCAEQNAALKFMKEVMGFSYEQQIENYKTVSGLYFTGTATLDATDKERGKYFRMTAKFDVGDYKDFYAPVFRVKETMECEWRFGKKSQIMVTCISSKQTYPDKLFGLIGKSVDGEYKEFDVTFSGGKDPIIQLFDVILFNKMIYSWHAYWKKHIK